jgi:IS5 family transposase
MNQIGLFDESIALERLSRLGDKLEWLDSVMELEIFRELLDRAKPDKTKEGKGGRPPLLNLMMFKTAVLQDLHGLSYEQMEFQINDRLSWKRFLGLGFSEKAPDATTMHDFRETLTNTGVYDALFDLFNKKMEEIGVITHKGSIVDASFVDVPRQRNSREENRVIKEGGVPEAWLLDENARFMSQKDVDAAWAKKNEELHYGYKDHVIADADSKMITDWRVTPANPHDSTVLAALIGGNVRELWGDSAYMSAKIMGLFKGHYPEIALHICEKGTKNNPLTDGQKADNREKSRIRSRIEHIFGHMTNAMGGMFIRHVGIERAECAIVMKNLVYNISRYASLRKTGRTPKMA